MRIQRNNVDFLERKDAAEFFDQLTSYISTFNKEWIHTIQPASKESIALLKKESEMEKWREDFPSIYQVYLERMGENDGGLLSTSNNGTSDITNIIGLYEDFHIFDPEVFETSYFSFFYKETGGEFSFDLKETTQNKIYETESGVVIRVKSENLEKLFLQSAYKQFERFDHFIYFSSSLNNLRKAKRFSEGEELFDTIDHIAKKYRLEKAWFSDEKYYIALGEDTSFCVEYIGGTWGFATSDNKKIFEELVKDIKDAIGDIR